MHSYFEDFHGREDCKLDASDLYTGPSRGVVGLFAHESFCTTRKDLLTSMSEGGRIGFDAPYIARERFERIIFIGDQSLQPLYSGLNMLLRQDLAYGTLRTWSLGETALEECRCENQFVKESCRKEAITSSEQVIDNIAYDPHLQHPNSNRYQHEPNLNKGRSYRCSQMIPHTFFEIDGKNLDKDAKLNPKTIHEFRSLFPKHNSPTYKHTAIILSLSPYQTQNTIAARQTLLSILDFISSNHQHEKHTVPRPNVLFLGPASPTHLTTNSKKDGTKTNQDVWDFHHNLARTAVENKAEVLGLWNMTAQVGSWDGERFGLGVVLTQTMMVLNWLARLESS